MWSLVMIYSNVPKCLAERVNYGCKMINYNCKNIYSPGQEGEEGQKF